MEEEIKFLRVEVAKLRSMLVPINLHEQAKMKLIEAIMTHKEFSSKRQWALYARVSMDTFYRIENEVIDQLVRQGYKVVYEPVSSYKDSRVYCYRVHLQF